MFKVLYYQVYHVGQGSPKYFWSSLQHLLQLNSTTLLCLPVKITKVVECVYTFLVNLMVTVELVRNLVGLLHSDGAEKSNKTVKFEVLFQNSLKKLQRLQNYMHSVIFHYITDFIYDEGMARNSPPAQFSITEDTPKHSLTAGNLLQKLKQHLEYTQTKHVETNWHTVMRMVKKFLWVFPIQVLY